MVLISTYSYIKAQEKLNYPSVDKITYDQYLAKDWKNLIKTAKKSLDADIDFYYLQVRTGIAYYELKQYARAVKYFENAYKQNPEDQLIQEYLYFAYLFAGRYDDARAFKSKMSTGLKERLVISDKNPTIKALYLDTKHDINEDYMVTPLPGDLLYQKGVLNQSYYNVSLEHWIGNKITIFHGYSNLGITNGIKDYHLDMPPLYKEYLIQHEYYLSLKANIAKGTFLIGGFHFMYSDYSAPDPTTTTVRSGRWGALSGSALYAYTEQSISGSLGFIKQFSIFNISGATSISNLNQNLQFQPELSFRIYPLGSQAFFMSAKALYLIEKEDSIWSYNPAVRPGLGVSFLKYSWLELSATFGDIRNYTELNSFIANNDLDKLTRRYEALLNIGLNKGKLNLFVKYQYNSKTNTFELNGINTYQPYISQTIAGGIKWYF
jgi:hypothetical protein